MKLKLLFTLFGLVLIPLALATMVSRKDDAGDVYRPEIPLPVVAVTSVTTKTHQSVIHGFGEAQARYVTSLAAEVQGRVVWVADQLERGERVHKGDPLVRIEDTPYREALARAQTMLGQNQLALLQEEREAAQARKDWARSGLKGLPESPLLLREPQLEAARQELSQAKAALASAELNLARTQILAPFDGVIASRQVAPGGYLQPGSEIASLFARDRVEIAVSLPLDQWRLLPEWEEMKTAEYRVSLKAKHSGSQWQGRVLRADWQIDRQNRQRTLVVAVDHPLDQQPALLPGTFVSVSFPSRPLQGLMKVPASALSRDGRFWFVTPENTLVFWKAAPVFQDGGMIFAEPPPGESEIALVVRPLAGFLPAMKVRPVVHTADEAPGVEVNHENQ